MRILTDQIGYLPDAGKLAVLMADGDARTGAGNVPAAETDGDAGEDAAPPVFLVRLSDGKRLTEIPVVVSGAVFDDTAGAVVRTADFSALRKPGRYLLETDDGSRSHAFSVAPRVYGEVKRAMAKMFYFQRCGCALPGRFAGVFQRPACHLRDAVLYEDHTKMIPIRGGWHDAGDFGRYPSAAAVALGHLLYAYELFPEGLADALDIPETGSGVPDILSECRYELEFLMRMQAADGGVYHKVTTLRHPDFLMPADDGGDLLVFPVSSVSTADFAAVMCIASRVFAPYDPHFARDAVHAAVQAGQWLLAHPDNIEFHNPADCNTGEYGDDDDSDERLWAFCELLRTDVEMRHAGDHSHAAAMPLKETRQEKYRRQVAAIWEKRLLFERQALARYDAECAAPEKMEGAGPLLSDGFGWGDVTALAITAALFAPTDAFSEEVLSQMRGLLSDKARRLVGEQERSPFRLAMRPRDFVWGSNMVVTNRADLLLLAALWDEPERARYEAAALEQLHYLFGRNAVDVSYVTGFGERAFRQPHNRVTACDGVEDPYPGEVSGGPCFPPRDAAGERLVPAGSAPQKCYADHVDCYSLNEITIYWNSSALFAAAYFDRDRTATA